MLLGTARALKVFSESLELANTVVDMGCLIPSVIRKRSSSHVARDDSISGVGQSGEWGLRTEANESFAGH